MTRQRGCPSPAELERAYWERDEALRAHAESCAHCALQWSDIEELAGLGAHVDVPDSPDHRREELRTALLASTRHHRDAPRWPWFAPATAAAAAAAALIVWWAWPGAQPAPEVDRRARVLAHSGASFLEAGERPDEILRLTEGTITVEVAPLRDGERFRVITGDAEVEVEGTLFDVTAERDRLVAVRVIHGIVEVRVAKEVATLGPGERWTRALVTAAVDEPAPEPAPAPPVVEPPAPAPAPAPVAVVARPRHRAPAIEPEPEPEPEPAADEPDAAVETPAKDAAQRAFEEAWLRMRDGEYDDAADAFERVMLFADDPRIDEDATYWRGIALARANRSKPARRAFEAFLHEYPKSSRAGEVSAMLGWLLFEAGLYDSAEPRFRRAADDDVERVRASAEQGLRAIRDER